MAVAIDKVAERFLNIQAGVAIPVAMPVYEARDIRVIYGILSHDAVQNVDYTITLANDFNTFSIVPTASLIAKIDALIALDPSEVNAITVRRELELTTTSTSALARYTPFTSREHDRSAMRDQQLSERLMRAVILGDRFVGGETPPLVLAELNPNTTLIVDPTGTQIVAGPTADQIEHAQEYAERAEAAASLIGFDFDNVAALLAFGLPLSPDAYVRTRAEGYVYQVMPSSSLSFHVTTVAGYKLRALAKDGRWEPDMFAVNAVPGTTNMTAAVLTAMNTGLARLNGVYLSSHLGLTGAANVELNGTLLRHPASPTGNFISTTYDFVMYGSGVVDCNKANTTTGCHGLRVGAGALTVHVIGVTFRNAKAVGGWGDGISLGTGQSAASDIRVIDVTAEDCDASGIAASDIRNGEIFNCRCLRNGGNGVFLNNFDTTFAQKIRATRVSHCLCTDNVRSGIGIGNFIVDNNISTGVRLYGFDNMEASDIVIEGNVCNDNGVYGIAAACNVVSILNNTVRRNGTVGQPNGGILSNSYRPSIIGNVVEQNIGYGIDSGGSNRPIIQGNTIALNIGTGCSIECTVLAMFSGNKVLDNGSGGTSEAAPGSPQVHTFRSGGDGNGNWFPDLTQQPHIFGNQFVLTQFRIGVRLDDGIPEPIVTDNVFWTSNPRLAVIDYANNSVISGNETRGISQGTTPLDGTVLNVPDIAHSAAVVPSGNPTITGVRTYSQRLVGSGVAWAELSNPGDGYTSAPTVVFSGGGGAGASAVCRMRAGKVVAVYITARGSGYTSPPTISFTGGGGSGAAATAVVGLPLRHNYKLELFANAPCTLASIAPDGPNISHPAGGNIAVPADGVVNLTARYGIWRVSSKNF